MAGITAPPLPRCRPHSATLTGPGANLTDHSGTNSHRRSQHSLEDVIAAVREAYGTPRSVLLRRHNRGCEARQVLLYLAATHCRGRYSLAELGQALGPVSLAAVSNARTKMLRHMASDPNLKKRVAVISKDLSKRIK